MSLFVENRSDFANVNANREDSSNKCFQINIEEFRRETKAMKNKRSLGLGGIASKLVKYERECLDVYLL